MHEMSLIEGITKVVAEKAAEKEIKNITKIKLVVGKLTNAFPEALQMAFKVLKAEERIFDTKAELEIEEKIIQGKCNDCSKEFEIYNNYSFLCAECGSLNVSIVSGRELYVDYFEGE